MNLITLIQIACVLMCWCAVSPVKSKKMTRTQKVQQKWHRIILLNNKKKDFTNNTLAAQIVKASFFDHEFQLGHKIKLICVAKGEPIPDITWIKDGLQLQHHMFAQISNQIVDQNQIRSKLEIDPARQMDAGTYECEANNALSIDRRQFKVDF